MSAPATGRRPGSLPLLRAQLGYAAVDLWRARVVLIFTFVLPIVWLLIVGAVAGNATIDQENGVRVMQFATPSAIAMGVLYATYPTVAISLAEPRELGVLKRLHGTPLPAWLFLAGRLGGAVIFALASIVACIAVGVAGFGVHLVWRTLPATVVTLIVGMACFAAIGLAVAALAPSVTITSAASVGTAVALTFVSGLYNFGGSSPAWLEWLGDVFPLKPFTQSLQDQFNPYHAGSGWEWGHLAVLAAWGLAAAVVAARFFRWEPHARRAGREEVADTARPVVAAPLVATPSGRPSGPALAADQARAAIRATLRDPAAVFFSVVMPLGIYVLISATQGGGERFDGLPFPAFFVASMAVWGTAVAVFMDLPQAVALARERAVLKRLRGTPLRPWQYLAGRTTAGLAVALVITVLLVATGTAFFAVSVPVAGLLAGLPVLLLGTLTMAACGFALAAVVPNARAISAVGLIILFPLGFFSGIFFPGVPAWMRTLGLAFPLENLQHALVLAWQPTGPQVGWGNLGVLLLWGAAAAAFAVRFFRWEIRAG